MKQNSVRFEAVMRPGQNPEQELQWLLARSAINGQGRAERRAKPPARVGLISSSPVGPLMVCLSGRAILLIQFLRERGAAADAIAELRRCFELIPDQSVVERVGEELERFVAGDEGALRSEIDLSLIKGVFQRRVLERLLEVGPGAIVSYSSLGASVGAPKAPRAVGGAMHDNPIPVYVPCHRVVRSDLSLGGYGGGLEVKRKLLSVEGFSFTPEGSVSEEGAVWGGWNKKIFCRPGCRALAHCADKMLFRDPARAAQFGMRPCAVCRPG